MKRIIVLFSFVLVVILAPLINSCGGGMCGGQRFNDKYYATKIPGC